MSTAARNPRFRDSPSKLNLIQDKIGDIDEVLRARLPGLAPPPRSRGDLP